MNATLTPADLVLLGVYYAILVVLAVFGLHRYALVRLRRKFSATQLPTPPPPEVWPGVTVQLPLYNEPTVAARLVDAAAALRYAGPLSIQVLDDSTDGTGAIVAARVAAHRRAGISIEHVRRGERAGFKAGALAHGLAAGTHELLAVFDADFVPPPDLLAEMVPWLGDPAVGMVQARWGHLNRETSTLTRAQAIYLDAHFAVESAARCFAGRFFNFNGTAGIWRRRAIEEAGGWSADTLTEDLDLSYRAQLAGWRFVFLPDVVVPAELPETIAAFHSQQRRWAKGSLQTARQLLPRVMRARLPFATKVEASFHLTNNSSYLLTLLLALLMVPAVALRQLPGTGWSLAIDAALFLASTVSVVAFWVEGQRQVGRAITLREILSVLPVGIGMSVVNGVAVVEGLFQRGGYFSRTPKSGGRRELTRLDRFDRVPVAETLLAAFFLGALWTFFEARHFLAMPFVLLFFSGYGQVVAGRLAERIRARE
jgi:cellulose synthase/poly-beta-1,6-N-acetylglucosamine synthase-like glycosyltransferase